jgi:hypothetical protein
MSDEKLKHKDYSTHSTRVLNRLVKIRMRQLEKLEAGSPSTDKSLAQLRYELNSVMNTLLERSMTRGSEINGDK